MPETSTPATESAATPAVAFTEPPAPTSPAPALPPFDPNTEVDWDSEHPDVEWKQMARKWEKSYKTMKGQLDADPRIVEYNRLVEASKTDLQRAQEEATRWQNDSQQWRTAALSSRVHALASAEFADPTDAVGALTDVAKYLTAGGEINDSAIQEDLVAVLQSKPHWRRQEGTPAPRPPAPNSAQGSGGPPATNPAAEFAALLQGQLSPR